MKIFVIKVALFLFVPIICYLFIEALLPPTSFTYRTWEALSFTGKIPKSSPFYPNMKTSKNAEGDLCHHTNKAIIKKELWITDKLGYRNDGFVEEADIIFIGDSFLAGSSLSQDEIISNRVKSRFNNKIKVYNMAPSSFSKFDYYLKTGIIKKPKLIIFSIVERNIPEPIVPFKKYSIKNIISELFEIGNMNVYFDKAFKCSSYNWLNARIHNYKGLGIPSKIDSNMFFYDGTSQKHLKKDLSITSSIIISYKKYCNSLGIKFLFMPMPDKETVYYELIPFSKQPNYLFQLDSLLNIANVSTINTLQLYNDYRKSNNKLLYHLDDTHWNSNATMLMSKEITKLLEHDKYMNLTRYMK